MTKCTVVEIRAKAFKGERIQKHEVCVVESIVDNPKWDGKKRSTQKMLKITVGVRDPETGNYTYNHDLCPAAVRRAIKLAMPWRVRLYPEGLIRRRFFTEEDALSHASRYGADAYVEKEGCL